MVCLIFYFPISRKEYVKEKYLLGAGMVTVLWAVAVAIAIGVNASGYRMVSWEELIASAAVGLFLLFFANAICVSDTVEIWKLYRKAGAACSCIWHHGCRMDWRRTMPENESGFFRSEKSGPGIWNLGILVCLAMLFCSYVANGSDFCTISIKIQWRKGVL